MHRVQKIIVILFLAWLSVGSFTYASGAKDVEPKRILIIYSYHEGLPWERLIDDSLRATLASKTSEPIELNVEHADRIRYPDDAYLQNFIDLLHHKYSHPKMDVVIGVDDEGTEILLKHGEELFPGVPIVFLTAERKTLQRDYLKPNMTSLLWGPDIKGTTDLILKMLPKTRQVLIITGSSISDRAVQNLARNTLGEGTNQLKIKYLADMTRKDLLQKVARLPENSAILYLALSRDLEGKNFVPREILSDISRKANAPAFGIIDTYLGFGIVGGSLLSAEVQGRRCAEISLRILGGKSPLDIVPERTRNILMFDARQLKRWGIREGQLPPDSIVRFKTPSFWETYRWFIITAILLIFFGYGFISLLLVQRKRLRQQFRFEQMLSNLSARFVNLSPDKISPQIERELETIGRLLEMDRVSVFEISEDTQRLIASHSYTDTDIERTPALIDFNRLSWARQKIFNGEMVMVSHLDELPSDAVAERDYLHSLGIQSAVAIPLKAGKSTLGILTVAMLRNRKRWPQGITRQFSLVAEVFANALTRKRSEQALVNSKNFNRSTLNSLSFHIAVLDRKGRILDVNESWRRFARENDAGSLDCLCTGINYLEVCRRSSDSGDEIAQAALQGIQSVLKGSCGNYELEYPCDSLAEKRWFLMRVTPFSGLKGGVIISHADITGRKVAEIDLHDAYGEIEQLKNKLEAEAAYLQEEIKLEHDFESIVGNSPAIQHVLFKVEQVADTGTTVLILGETGTGNELVARAIHNRSLRGMHPLVKVNCAALPSSLIESELFGHEPGAFTGAGTRQIGRFEVADGTSIFLDEIGDLPLELQTKLLQVLQDGEFERLGNPRTIKVDVRVIAATNRDLDAQVRRGEFREDLFYRLNVFPLTVPRLRDRVNDIPLLAEFFMEKASKRLGKSITVLPTSVMNSLRNHAWPGNVRELENVIERAVINSSGPKLRLAEELVSPQKDMPSPLKTMEAIEFDHIVRILDHTDWKVSGNNSAAEILGLKRGTLIARMKKLGIQKP